MMKRFFTFTLMLLILLYSRVSYADNSGVTVQAKTIKNQKLNVVEVDLSKSNLQFKVVKGNDQITGAESFAAMIKKHQPLVAINANFFDAYAGLEPYGTIIQDNQLLYLEGKKTSLSVFENNQLYLDFYQIKLLGYLDGLKKNSWNNQTQAMDFNTFSVWYVNVLPNDPTGVYLFTPPRDSLDLPEGTAVLVKDHLVERVIPTPQKLTVPANGYIIFYAKKAAPQNYIDDRFKLGRKVSFDWTSDLDEKPPKLLNIGSATSPAAIETFDIQKTKQLISAGPLLVKDSKIALDPQREGFKEAKILSSVAQRSAIGLTADNKLILVTTQMTMKDLALAMQALGCTHAMNLDGGASSGLYANGKMLTSPGRKLNTVFMITQ